MCRRMISPRHTLLLFCHRGAYSIWTSASICAQTWLPSLTLADSACMSCTCFRDFGSAPQNTPMIRSRTRAHMHVHPNHARSERATYQALARGGSTSLPQQPTRPRAQSSVRPANTTRFLIENNGGGSGNADAWNTVRTSASSAKRAAASFSRSPADTNSSICPRIVCQSVKITHAAHNSASFKRHQSNTRAMVEVGRTVMVSCTKSVKSTRY